MIYLSSMHRCVPYELQYALAWSFLLLLLYHSFNRRMCVNSIDVVISNISVCVCMYNFVKLHHLHFNYGIKNAKVRVNIADGFDSHFCTMSDHRIAGALNWVLHIKSEQRIQWNASVRFLKVTWVVFFFWWQKIDSKSRNVCAKSSFHLISVNFSLDLTIKKTNKIEIDLLM